MADARSLHLPLKLLTCTCTSKSNLLSSQPEDSTVVVTSTSRHQLHLRLALYMSIHMSAFGMTTLCDTIQDYKKQCIALQAGQAAPGPPKPSDRFSRKVCPVLCTAIGWAHLYIALAETHLDMAQSQTFL